MRKSGTPGHRRMAECSSAPSALFLCVAVGTGQAPKPVFHSYRMMNDLGHQIPAQVPGGIVTRFSKSGLISVMTCNDPPEMKASLPVSNTLEEAHGGQLRCLHGFSLVSKPPQPMEE